MNNLPLSRICDCSVWTLPKMSNRKSWEIRTRTGAGIGPAGPVGGLEGIKFSVGQVTLQVMAESLFVLLISWLKLVMALETAVAGHFQPDTFLTALLHIWSALSSWCSIYWCKEFVRNIFNSTVPSTSSTWLCTCWPSTLNTEATFQWRAGRTIKTSDPLALSFRALSRSTVRHRPFGISLSVDTCVSGRLSFALHRPLSSSYCRKCHLFFWSFPFPLTSRAIRKGPMMSRNGNSYGWLIIA